MLCDCSNNWDQPKGMRVLGETELARVITELEGMVVVQLFAMDLEACQDTESKRQYLKELFAPYLPAGDPLVDNAAQHESHETRRHLIKFEDEEGTKESAGVAQTPAERRDLGFGAFQQPASSQTTIPLG
jgi:hypothetical protein